MRTRSIIGMGISITLVSLAGCGGDNGAGPGPKPDAGQPDASDIDASWMDAPDASSPDAPAPEASRPKVSTTPSHGSTIALTEDDSRLVVANHDVGTATVFSIDYASAALPTLTKLAEIDVGAEPSAVVIHPNGDAAFVLSRKDQKLVKITGLQSMTPAKGAEVQVGSEPTGLAMTPLGSTVYVANWVDGTVLGIATDTMTVSTTIDLNATLAAAPYLGAGLSSRPALAHPRAVAITNNGDMVENDESLLVTEYFAQQKSPIASDASNAATNWVGVVYKVPLSSKTPAILEIPAMTDIGFQDHNGKTAGCFVNQLSTINIQGSFAYVNSVCADPVPPVSLFNGPTAAACTTDATCPGAAAGSCNITTQGTCTGATTMCKTDADCGGTAGACKGVVGTCKTNCATNAQCGTNGGRCVPPTGTDPSVGGNCAPNPADVKRNTGATVTVIDIGGNKTIATVNLNKQFMDYFDAQKMADDATRRLPLFTSDIGFVPGTVTAYFAAYGADAVFRVDFDATYAAATIDTVGDSHHPFISLFSPAIDASHNGQLPSGIVVGHQTHTTGSTLRYAYVANERTRNVTVVDLDLQEIAGLSANTPTTAAASDPETDPNKIDILEGKRKFITGLGRWSWNGQCWGGCATCHGDGYTDNVSWPIGRGFRQSPNVDASFVKGAAAKGDPTDYRINSWEGVQDEMTDHAGGTRSLVGGVGAIVTDNQLLFSSALTVANTSGLNASSVAVADPSNPLHLTKPSVLTDWPQIMKWARTIRTPRRPTNLDSAKVSAGQTLFTGANCQGCHSGPLWTVSQVFYLPDPTNATNAKLKTLSWSTAVHNSGFPLALIPVPDNLPAPPMGATYSGQTMRYSGSSVALYDQLTCAIRNVGTWGVAQGEAGVVELRSDLKTLGSGNDPDSKGFNVPSLLGVQVGAPYLHAGNALSLEALFSPTFKAHYQALSSTFLPDSDTARADNVAALIQYILSIDGDATPIAIPALGPTGGVFCAAQ